MKELLKELQYYQMEALDKGVAYDLDLMTDEVNSPDITVRMSYVRTTTWMETRTFQATFTVSTDEKISKMKLGRIRKFIEDVNDKQE